jgi:Tectonin domain
MQRRYAGAYRGEAARAAPTPNRVLNLPRSDPYFRQQGRCALRTPLTTAGRRVLAPAVALLAVVAGVLVAAAGAGAAGAGAGAGAATPAAASLPNSRGIATALNADGRIELLALDSADHVFDRSQNAGGGNTWAPWVQLDGLLSSVAAETNADGRIEIFGVNAAGTVFHRSQTSPNAASWTTWSTLDGTASRVAATHLQDGRLVLVGVNAASQVFVRAQTAPNTADWQPWSTLDGLLTDVAAEVNQNGQIQLFGVNSAGTIFYRTQTGPSVTSWTSWSVLDGALTRIAVSGEVSLPTTHILGPIRLAGVNSGSSVFIRRQNGTADLWTGWTHLDGLLTNITTTMDTDARIHVFGVNSAGTVFQRFETRPGSDAFTAWRDVDAAPTVVSVPNLAGLRQTQAQNALIAAGLTPGPVTDPNSCGFLGRVSAETPAALTVVPPGSAVGITLSC